MSDERLVPAAPALAPGEAVAAAARPLVARLGPWLAITASAALVVAWLFTHPELLDEPSRCVFRRFLGVACPGCGMTRALGALLHGRWGEVWHFHPFAPVLAVELVAAWALWAAWAFRLVKAPPRERIERRLEIAVLANGALLVLVWLVRVRLHALPW